MAERHYYQREGFSALICSLCFRQNPQDEELTGVYCKAPRWHHGAPTVLVTWSTDWDALVEIRPLPQKAARRFVMCPHSPNCMHYPDCTFAHSKEEETVWNTQNKRRIQQTTSGPANIYSGSKSYSQRSSGRKINYQDRCREKTEKMIADAKRVLTQRTYRLKFYSLLYHEERKHADLLSKRCNGTYQLNVYEFGSFPPCVRNGNPRSRYGCLSGMTGDQIMYASQASQCLFIVNKNREQICAADVLQENMQGHYEGMLIEFKDENAIALERHNLTGFVRVVNVEFEVKHFYFDLLHESLEAFSNLEKIYKVMPDPPRTHIVSDGPPLLDPPGIYSFLKLDKESQLPALSKVVNSGSQYPVLVSGAFGTGKTRLLAVATYQFIEEGRRRNEPTRVLIACHHQVTADTFIEEYFGKMVETTTRKWEVKLARITRARYYIDKKNYPRRYLKQYEFQDVFDSEYRSEKFVVVVTTLLTSLKFHKFIGDGYFTHILLDEAAQAREPEAIAPLIMANTETKIVIAGDDCQVGPEILVLGDIARDNGLKTSIFTRLLEFYNKYELPVAFLTTNYRCHEEIVHLARTLFYSQSLTPRADPEKIPGLDKPIWFVCSSLKKTFPVDKETDKDEATALIKQLKTFFKPRQMNDVCIMATNRHQLSDIKGALFKESRSFIPTQFVPTYLIQGEEFKALFMSTVEAIDASGCSFNPTKSLCTPSVFNTAITRAKSLIVAVGNPYILMRMEKMEKKMGNNKQCWAEYLHRCFEMGTTVAGEGITQNAIKNLKEFVENQLGRPVQERIQDKNRSKQGLMKKEEEEEKVKQVHSKGPAAAEPNLWPSTSALHHETRPTLQQQKIFEELTTEQAKCANAMATIDELKKEIEQKEEEICYRQQQLEEMHETCDMLENEQWMDKKEVVITEEVLGKGAWGVVKVAKFRGLRVAAKFLHSEIVSRHNCKKFLKEGAFSFKLRHPNLLQFIGAIRTDEGNLVIINELMPTSLRKELEKNELTKEQVITISQDVSCGLNYMHQFRPHPIIHCDISSGNVLLEPFSNHWKAKISDYGSANFTSFTEVAPGAPIYSAPEAKNPDRHSTKMDVYSFGVLIIEMCLRELPAEKFEEKNAQIGLIRWTEMVDKIIRRCIEEQPNDRPDASEIMSILDEMYIEHTCTR